MKKKWNLTNSNNADFIDIDGETRICSIDISEPVLEEQGITKEDAWSNARLIAAAPELFQMVKDLKNCINRLTADDVTQAERGAEAEWIGNAHELLIKANGGAY